MKKTAHPSNDRKSGQAIIFLIMVLVIGSIVVLWNFDLHNIVSTKIRIDNSGDAAALSAARWQGITLNMIGELNLAQVAFICDRLAEIDPREQDEADIIIDEVEETFGDLKRRLALIGPLMGMVSAQSSAIKNLTEKDVEMVEEASSRYMKQRGADFENSNGSYMGVVDAPYDGAWEEYGGLLSTIANNTMLAECGNTQYFLFYSSSHRLLSPSFYNAVRAPDYCYFRNSGEFVSSFEDYTSWDPLPELVQRHTVNSEYFSTDVYEYGTPVSIGRYYGAKNGHVQTLTNYYPDLDIDVGELTTQFLEYLEDTPPASDADDLDMMAMWGMNLECTWHYFERGSWMKILPDSDDFPFHEGWGFKDEYSYGGANAAVDVRIGSKINTPGMQLAVGDIYWQAAAKPFGYLEDPKGAGRVVPMYYGLVLPAFHDIRLIHNDLSTRQSGVSAPGWEEHIYVHVPDYMDGGLPAIEENDCSYCNTLEKWEDESFRDNLSTWLEDNEEAIRNGTECNTESNGYSGNPSMGRG